MGNSLQDQLLKAGLASEAQAKKAEARKVPKKRGKKKGRKEPALSESAQQARQAMADKAQRDRALNQRRRAEADAKAISAQVRQLIEQNRLPREEGDVAYNFVFEGKVRRVYVTAEIHSRLIGGSVAIVRLDSIFEVVPAGTAEKVRSRDPGCVVDLQTTESPADESDLYKDYKVPDDLMW